MMSAKQIREIQIRVNTRGDKTLANLSKEFAKVSKQTNKFAKNSGTLKNAFLGLQGFFAGKWSMTQFVGMLDGMQKLTDRLTITEGSTEGAMKALKGLSDVANNTKVSIEDISVVYNRLHMAMGDAGLSSEALIGFTETLQNTFRLSGATAAEATGAVIQLSQGLASGQLRGQELRSVLEANVVIGDILAKQFGTTRGELIKFAEKNGGLDAVGVFKALGSSSEDLAIKTSKLNSTISEALTTNMNKLKVELNQLNREYGVSKKAVDAINWSFENMNLILVQSGALLVAWKVKALTATGIMAGFAKAGALVATSLTAIKAGLVLLSGPVGLAVAGFAALGTGVAYAVKHVRQAGFDKEAERVAKFNDVMKKASDSMFDMSDATNTFVSSAREGGKVTLGMFGKDQNHYMAKTTAMMLNFGTATNDSRKAFIEAAKTLKSKNSDVFSLKKSLAEINNAYMDGKLSLRDYNKALKQVRLDKLNEDVRTGAIDMKEYNKRLHEITHGKKKSNAEEMQRALASMNQEVRNGTLSLEEYGAKVRAIEVRNATREFDAGRMDVLKFHESLNTQKVQEYNMAWRNGTMTFHDFSEALNTIKSDQLYREFEMGKISLTEFDAKLNEVSTKLNAGSALRQGLNDYVNSVGTMNTAIASGVTNSFNMLEDRMMSFMETGRFAFADFAKDIISEINRIIIRAMIIQPLANGILGAMPSASAGIGNESSAGFVGPVQPKALGGAFLGSKEAFASGGVVTGRTNFNFGGNRGVMGEKGPEAIIPLSRDSGGKLGIEANGMGGSNVVINVINNSDSQIEQRESTDSNGNRQLDIIIASKVKEQFAKGTYDRTMSEQYGLKRRGR